jgi:hypothetical protein
MFPARFDDGFVLRRPFGVALRFLLVALLGVGAASCSDDDDALDMAPEPDEDISLIFPSSLHATGRGMEYWYEAEQGGFENETGVAYEQLPCAGCHTPATCTNCHSDVPGITGVPQSVCLGCHGRQRAEIMKQLPDVHRDAGMVCTDCHSLHEMHGDGTPYNSMFEEGATDTRCETCHTELSDAPAHLTHGDDLACATCHMESAVTCLNCHFAAEVEEHRKVAHTKADGWMMLGNFRGKVFPMNFQSVEYYEHSFVAYGPFTGHSISETPRDCADCHGNDAAQAYLQEGVLKIVDWNPATSKLENRKGVIPIPPDFITSLRHDFATLDQGIWSFLEEGPDRAHMLYGEPLTREQIEKLAGPAGGS